MPRKETRMKHKYQKIKGSKGKGHIWLFISQDHIKGKPVSGETWCGVATAWKEDLEPSDQKCKHCERWEAKQDG